VKRLPVDPARLRGQFPELSEPDLEAYATVTRRVLRDPARQGRALRDVMLEAAAALEKRAAGRPLSQGEELVLRYRLALDKMQRPGQARG
jgi:hypothetical protein